jgi:hypothetical protein
MRDKLGGGARHDKPVFSEDFVALTKCGDLRRLDLAIVNMAVVVHGAVAAFAPREHDQTEAGRQA